jgi:SOS-response transcriptional repressor LexA
MDRAIVLAKIEDEYTLKRYRKARGKIWLEPDPIGGDYPIIEIPDGVELQVFGVMTSLVRTYF